MNVGGQLMDLSRPQVMGILNVTPDSFYGASRKETDEQIRSRALEIVAEGGSVIDVGACSTRPGSTPVTAAEEMERLRRALHVVHEAVPDAVLSVDTFRADVAKMCVEEFDVQIVNDVTGGDADADMFRTVATLGVPYVLTDHSENTEHALLFLAERLSRLRSLGQKDIIIDPGFGFGKDVEGNYEVLRHLEMFRTFDLPILIGVSRKRMIYQLLGTSADEALNGTSVVNTICLMKGCAQLIRVHDVKAAVETVEIVEKMSGPSPSPSL